MAHDWMGIAIVSAAAALIVLRIQRRPRRGGGPTIFWFGIVPVVDSPPPRVLNTPPDPATASRNRLFLDSGNICITLGDWLIYAHCATLLLWLAIVTGVAIWWLKV